MKQVSESSRRSRVELVGWIRRRGACTPAYALWLLAPLVVACGGSDDEAPTPDRSQDPAPETMALPAGDLQPAAGDSQPPAGEEASEPPGSGAGVNEDVADSAPLQPDDLGGSGDPPGDSSAGGDDGAEMSEPGDSEPGDEAAEAPAEQEPAEEEEEPAQPEAFAPCPTDGEPCRIMPLGDSITFGIGSSQGGAYRVELFRNAVVGGHDITFVGTSPGGGPNGPQQVEGQPFPRDHEGISGNTIQQVAGRVDAALAANPPHIVLLHIGTNNLYQGLPTNVPGLLESLIDQIIEGAPDALVVVAQLVPGQTSFNGFGGQQPFNQTVQAYNATIPGFIEERAAEGKHVALVDMFDPFVANAGGSDALMNDVVHPNDAGYAVMAGVWYSAIESYLP